MVDMKQYAIKPQVWDKIDLMVDPDAQHPAVETDKFMKTEYGLACTGGWIYNVVDEKKFTKFLLKYG